MASILLAAHASSDLKCPSGHCLPQRERQHLSLCPASWKVRGRPLRLLEKSFDALRQSCFLDPFY